MALLEVYLLFKDIYLLTFGIFIYFSLPNLAVIKPRVVILYLTVILIFTSSLMFTKPIKRMMKFIGNHVVHENILSWKHISVTTTPFRQIVYSTLLSCILCNVHVDGVPQRIMVKTTCLTSRSDQLHVKIDSGCKLFLPQENFIKKETIRM